MKRILSIALICLLMLGTVPMVTLADSPDALSIFVQSGAEEGTGSIDSPFGTIEEARDYIRTLKDNGNYPQKGVTVYIRGGEYNINQGIEFDERDSGTKEGPITYRAYRDESVTFTAGFSLDVSQFKAVTDKAVLSRIPATSQGQILQANLLDYGLTLEDLGKMYSAGARASTLIFIKYYGSPQPNAELFFEGNNMTLARWPNDDYTRIGEVVRVGDLLRNDMAELTTPEPVGSIFKGAGERLSSWQTAPDAWAHGYWQYDWLDCAAKIKKVDPEEGTVELVHTVEPVAGKRFYVYNLLEELDIKGEWYLERETGILYFYPPKKSGKVTLSLSLDRMFSLNNVENVNFKAFTMTAARNDFFSLESCRNVNIENCEISYTAGSAVVMNKCYDCAVRTCHIYGIGKHGIGLHGGDSETLEPGNNIVENCWIHNFSRLMKNSAPAVTLGGVGNKIVHNRINDAPQWAIRLNGNDHVIEYNEIYDVLKESADAGVIYAWCSLVNYGNVIRHNYIHDCETDSEQSHGIMCFYFDKLFSGTTVESNIIENFPGAVLAINGGRDTTFRNNIMINCDSFTAMSGTGNYGLNHEEFNQESQRKQLGISDEDPVYKKPAYAKYPTLPGLMDDILSSPAMDGTMGGIHPRRNLIENNVGINLKEGVTTGYLLGLTPEYVMSENTYDQPWMTASDPGFADYVGRNYTLKEDSKIYGEFSDFEAPDFENIGIYTPELNERLTGAVSMRVDSPVIHKGLTWGLVDNDNTDVAPVIHNSKTMVPVRFMAETLGGTAEWNADTQTATIIVGENTLVINGADGTMLLNGTQIEGESPISLNGRFLVPLRVIAEAMNKKVDWYEQGMIVVSDTENLFDKEVDALMIEELYRRLSFR